MLISVNQPWDCSTLSNRKAPLSTFVGWHGVRSVKSPILYLGHSSCSINLLPSSCTAHESLSGVKSHQRDWTHLHYTSSQSVFIFDLTFSKFSFYIEMKCDVHLGWCLSVGCAVAHIDTFVFLSSLFPYVRIYFCLSVSLRKKKTKTLPFQQSDLESVVKWGGWISQTLSKPPAPYALLEMLLWIKYVADCHFRCSNHFTYLLYFNITHISLGQTVVKMAIYVK